MFIKRLINDASFYMPLIIGSIIVCNFQVGNYKNLKNSEKTRFTYNLDVHFIECDRKSATKLCYRCWFKKFK